MTIRAGGPLEGVVTLTAIEDGHGRMVVGASWTKNGHAQSDSVEVESYEHARILASEVADELAAGWAPDLARIPIWRVVRVDELPWQHNPFRCRWKREFDASGPLAGRLFESGGRDEDAC